jgi:hypothetical protein
MAILALISVYILILAYDTPSILKLKKASLHMILYFTISFIGFVVSLLQIIDKPPISPSKIIENIVKAVVKS